MAHPLESMLPSGILPGVQRAAEAHRNTTSNLFGRSAQEASFDFVSLIRSFQRSPSSTRHPTPALVHSDSSPPSSPSNWSAISQISSRENTPFIAPDIPPSKVVTRTAVEVQFDAEDHLVSATRAMDIRSDQLHLEDRESTDSTPHINITIDLPDEYEEDEDETDVGTPPRTLPALRTAVISSETATQDILDACAAISMLRAGAGAKHQSPTSPPSTSSAINPPQPTVEKQIQAPTVARNMTVPISTPFVPAPFPTPTTPLRPNNGKKKISTPKIQCSQCPKLFTRNFDMKRHMDSVHAGWNAEKARMLTCPCCYLVLSRADSFRRHCLKVPFSCIRAAKLEGKEEPPKREEDLYNLCRAGKAPLVDLERTAKGMA